MHCTVLALHRIDKTGHTCMALTSPQKKHDRTTALHLHASQTVPPIQVMWSQVYRSQKYRPNRSSSSIPIALAEVPDKKEARDAI